MHDITTATCRRLTMKTTMETQYMNINVTSNQLIEERSQFNQFLTSQLLKRHFVYLLLLYSHQTTSQINQTFSAVRFALKQ